MPAEQKSFSEGEEIKTPFDKIRCGLPIASKNQKEDDSNSLAHMKWKGKCRIVFGPKYQRKEDQVSEQMTLKE